MPTKPLIYKVPGYGWVVANAYKNYIYSSGRTPLEAFQAYQKQVSDETRRIYKIATKGGGT